MKIGLICGCFDLFHVGHLNILENAKRNCDKLLVGVCDDKYVESHKHGSVINENDRKRIIQALKCVDETYLVDEHIIQNRLDFCRKHGVNVVFDGDDLKNSNKYAMLTENGIEVIFFPYTNGISTTQLKQKLKS